MPAGCSGEEFIRIAQTDKSVQHDRLEQKTRENEKEYAELP
jgi:hypothetical protein